MTGDRWKHVCGLILEHQSDGRDLVIDGGDTMYKPGFISKWSGHEQSEFFIYLGNFSKNINYRSLYEKLTSGGCLECDW